MFTVDTRVEDGWRTTRVRILEAWWGMAVDLVARAVDTTDGDDADGLVPAGPGVLLDLRDVDLVDSDVRALTRGVRLTATAGTHEPATTIRLRDLRWTRPDYQSEAATIAMSHWLADHLGTAAPEFAVVYDRATDRYWVSP